MSAQGSRTGMCALRAREEEWRHARSTRDEGRSEMRAVVADPPLAEKCGDAPRLCQISADTKVW